MAEIPERILVFIPAYNCEPQIPRVLAKFAGVPQGLFAEILVVDNHSKDSTREAAISAAQKLSSIPVRVVQNTDNYGLGGSHKSAFTYALENGFDYIVVLHGDDQGSIADIVPLLQQGTHRDYDACLGSRFMRGSRLKNYSAFRIFGNHVFNSLFTIVSGRRVTDLGSGLNLFSKNVFTQAEVYRSSDDLRFNCYLLLDLVALKKKFIFFPISWSEEDQVSNVKMFSQSMRTLKILWEYLSSKKKFLGDDHRDTPRESYTFRVLGGN